jgi:Rps23 Pro-64 3,4-dihydroxylase Tpa1-like proline 4-hydroxylase
MSADRLQSDNGNASDRSLMPPHLVLRDFLEGTTVASLLDYVQSRQADFAPTRLKSARLDPSLRQSTALRDLGPFKPVIDTKLFSVVPTLMQELRLTPFDVGRTELELVAHGDGAFYKRHIDTRTSSDPDLQQIRVLSGVYYFNAEPKAFTGGALRLYAIGGNAADFVDIEPVRNSLLVFPSWAPHEVMPVNCPSKRFLDSRFAINCWVRRKEAAAVA